MPRTAVAVTALSRAGVTPPAATATDAVNKNYVSNDGRVWLELKNTDAGPRTVGFQIIVKVDGQSPAARTVAIPAGATRLVGPFPTTEYGSRLGFDTDSALVTVNAYGV